MKRIILMVLLLCSIAGFSQTFEEYRKQEEERFNLFKKQQEEELARLRKEFAEYVEQRDRDFARYLEQEWKSWQVYAGRVPPEKPKPTLPPKYNPTKEPVGERKTTPLQPLPVKNVLPLPQSALIPAITAPVREPVMPAIKGEASETFNFYGVPVYLDYDPAFRIEIKVQSGYRAVADYWKAASATEYSQVVEQLMQYKEQFNLNDYAYYLLVKKFSENLYPGQKNGQVLCTWYLMVRSGYGVRIGSDGPSLILLLPSRQVVYACNYLNDQGLNYYLIDEPSGTKIQTYDQDYAGSTRCIDFNIPSPIRLGDRIAHRQLTFDYQGSNYSFDIAYDPALVGLLKDYPQLEMQVYFNATVSSQLKESLANAVLPLINERDEKHSVNFLLALVQKAFAYKTDPEQFGYEKFFFPDEVLHYPYSDCEDRSALFAWLVRDLVGLDVVGLQYHDHMATAIRFTTPVEGDFVISGNEKYIVADPTYIGAPLGRCMPEYLNESPVLIAMNNLRNDANTRRNIWLLASAGGCRPASNLPNVAVLNNGNTAVTGVYQGQAHFLGKQLPESTYSQSCFVGVAKSDNQPVWVTSLAGTGIAAGLSATADAEGNIYVAGIFSGKLSSGKFTLNTRNQASSDAFVASFSASGHLRWIHSVGLDTLPVASPLSFSAIFSSQGKKLNLNLSLPGLSYEKYGIFANAEGHIIFNATMNLILSQLPATEKLVLGTGMEALTPEMIKQENDRLISDQTDRSIAGIIATAGLVYRTGYPFSGRDAQTVLDKYNPQFRKRFSETFNKLGKITYIKNQNGVITLFTEDGSDVVFDKLKVRNGASLTMSQMPNGDIQFNVLSGLSVGKAIVWYDLNMIRLYRLNGDMLFDYDSDHTCKRLNLKRDLLK